MTPEDRAAFMAWLTESHEEARARREQCPFPSEQRSFHQGLRSAYGNVLTYFETIEDVKTTDPVQVINQAKKDLLAIARRLGALNANKSVRWATAEIYDALCGLDDALAAEQARDAGMTVEEAYGDGSAAINTIIPDEDDLTPTGPMASLVGKTITKLAITTGEHTLIFETDKGPVAYNAGGDCCSETWFADIIGVPYLINHRVLKTEEIEVPESLQDEARGRQDYDCYYGVKIVTDLGYCDIIFRNSSNGYYGGWIEQVTTISPSLHALLPITTDWSA